MAQGTTGVTRHTTVQYNAGVHQNIENTGVHQNTGVKQNKANMDAPKNYHDDPHNDPSIKTENTIDAAGDEDENEELEEVPV